jgi:N-methylhydantoinase A
MVDRFHYTAPKIEVVSIGAGGGSIISLDPASKAPRVGPRSAGARPGPVCYGLGGDEPTLTDVLMLIGYMDPDIFLGGSMRLDADAARRVFAEKIARPLGMPVEEAAFGVYRVAAAQITDLIHEITVERGLDPRDFVLHAFGGSCGMLCGMFGAELNVKRIVVPYTASVNCALGLISADIAHEYATTMVLPVPSPADAVNAIYRPMMEKAVQQLRAEGFSGSMARLDWSIDLRYSRQVHEVTTPVRAATPLDEAGRGFRSALRAQIRQGLGLSRGRNGDDAVPPDRARLDDPARGHADAALRRRCERRQGRPPTGLRRCAPWLRAGRHL